MSKFIISISFTFQPAYRMEISVSKEEYANTQENTKALEALLLEKCTTCSGSEAKHLDELRLNFIEWVYIWKNLTEETCRTVEYYREYVFQREQYFFPDDHTFCKHDERSGITLTHTLYAKIVCKPDQDHYIVRADKKQIIPLSQPQTIFTWAVLLSLRMKQFDLEMPPISYIEVIRETTATTTIRDFVFPNERIILSHSSRRIIDSKEY